MGEAADDAWDSMMNRQFELLNAQEGARKHCAYPGKPCHLVKNEPDNWKELDWWPALKCAVCGKEFDL
jgi:hypothetical protein